MYIFVDKDIIDINIRPSNKDRYAIIVNIFLFLKRFTTEWNLNSSIPVSESNKSLVKFSQNKINIDANVNAKKLPILILLNKYKLKAADINTGIIATE